MKKKVKVSTVIGTVILLVCTAGIGYTGYRVIAKSGEVPGKLMSLSTAADNLYYNNDMSYVRTMSRVQKVDYETMKYGYLDDVNLARMDYLDTYYDNERMVEVRAKNDLTAMENWSSDVLAYEEFKAEQEEAAKKAIAEAEAAEAAAEAARKAKIDAITASILKTDEVSTGYIDVGDSSNLGYGDTATNGGAIGPKVIADKHGESLGIFNITAYCTCRVCCGVYSGRNRTASGTVPTSNRTVAVDRSIIPFGTKLVINGQVYVAEDVGGAIQGKHIDMFFYTHAEATRWGKRNMEVFYYD
ncbi:MAG: 3D domain-containing protein [Lachnospiraceae bacterium]